jgi:hypothetical protein
VGWPNHSLNLTGAQSAAAALDRLGPKAGAAAPALREAPLDEDAALKESNGE